MDDIETAAGDREIIEDEPCVATYAHHPKLEECRYCAAQEKGLPVDARGEFMGAVLRCLGKAALGTVKACTRQEGEAEQALALLQELNGEASSVAGASEMSETGGMA